MQGTAFDGGRELEKVMQEHPLLGSLLKRVIQSMNKLAQNAGVSAIGQLPAPPPVDNIDVKGTLDQSTNTLTVPTEILHWAHTHNVPLQRGIQYVTEVDTDPSFPNPHPISQHTSRSGFHPLSTYGDGGVPDGKTDYFLRVIPQMPGGEPGTPTVFGTKLGPTKINFTGSSAMSLLPSQAAGTARPGQGGKGLGPVPARGPVGGPKRDLG